MHNWQLWYEPVLQFAVARNRNMAQPQKHSRKRYNWPTIDPDIAQSSLIHDPSTFPYIKLLLSLCCSLTKSPTHWHLLIWMDINKYCSPFALFVTYLLVICSVKEILNYIPYIHISRAFVVSVIFLPPIVTPDSVSAIKNCFPLIYFLYSTYDVHYKIHFCR